jgi:hypothetical protein
LVDNDMPVGTITLNGGFVNAVGVQLLLKTTDATATVNYTGQTISDDGITLMFFTVSDANGTRGYELIGPRLPEGGGNADFTLTRLT